MRITQTIIVYSTYACAMNCQWQISCTQLTFSLELLPKRRIQRCNQQWQDVISVSNYSIWLHCPQATELDLKPCKFLTALTALVSTLLCNWVNNKPISMLTFPWIGIDRRLGMPALPLQCARLSTSIYSKWKSHTTMWQLCNIIIPWHNLH